MKSSLPHSQVKRRTPPPQYTGAPTLYEPTPSSVAPDAPVFEGVPCAATALPVAASDNAAVVEAALVARYGGPLQRVRPADASQSMGAAVRFVLKSSPYREQEDVSALPPEVRVLLRLRAADCYAPHVLQLHAFAVLRDSVLTLVPNRYGAVATTLTNAEYARPAVHTRFTGHLMAAVDALWRVHVLHADVVLNNILVVAGDAGANFTLIDYDSTVTFEEAANDEVLSIDFRNVHHLKPLTRRAASAHAYAVCMQRLVSSFDVTMDRPALRAALQHQLDALVSDYQLAAPAVATM